MPLPMRALLGLMIALLACTALYWPAMHGPFLFDDFPNLSALKSIDSVSSWRDIGIYLSQPRNFPGRPIAMLSFLAQRSEWPDHPLPFKLVNLAIHLCNGLLVACLAFRVSRTYLANRCSDRKQLSIRSTQVALLAMAAFLLNPIQLSAVLLAVQRMTLLVTMFTLLGLIGYVHALVTPALSPLRQASWIVLGVCIGTALAYLCKENGLLLPMYASVLAATVLRQQRDAMVTPLRWLHIILLGVPTACVLGYLIWKAPDFAAGAYQRNFTLSERLLTEPRVILDYLSKVFLPRFGVYGLFNDSFTPSRGFTSPLTTLPALLIVLASVCLGVWSRRRWPLLGFAVLWYAGGQVIESTTPMPELYFEHRNYLPLIGPFIALAIAVIRTDDVRTRKLAISLTFAWLAACSFATLLSARVWSSEDTLAQFWSRQFPYSSRAQTMLVDRLYQHGRPDLAAHALDDYFVRRPDDTALREIRAYMSCMQQQLTAEDLSSLELRIRTGPYDMATYLNVEKLRILAEAGTCPALTGDRWQRLVKAALENPVYAKNGAATGYLHYQLHQYAVDKGDLDRAVKELSAANAADPDPDIPRLQAKYLASAGLYDQAIGILENTDYSRLPLLRRIWVNDREINAESIDVLVRQRAEHPSRN